MSEQFNKFFSNPANVELIHTNDQYNRGIDHVSAERERFIEHLLNVAKDLPHLLHSRDFLLIYTFSDVDVCNVICEEIKQTINLAINCDGPTMHVTAPDILTFLQRQYDVWLHKQKLKNEEELKDALLRVMAFMNRNMVQMEKFYNSQEGK